MKARHRNARVDLAEFEIVSGALSLTCFGFQEISMSKSLLNLRQYSSVASLPTNQRNEFHHVIGEEPPLSSCLRLVQQELLSSCVCQCRRGFWLTCYPDEILGGSGIQIALRCMTISQVYGSQVSSITFFIGKIGLLRRLFRAFRLQYPFVSETMHSLKYRKGNQPVQGSVEDSELMVTDEWRVSATSHFFAGIPLFVQKELIVTFLHGLLQLLH
ncbi:hypothetical protein OUZ56_016704 [Daphnia magna]|uniref:Uncharacterized protein n=1 Tax=Daphnia magna TaxID=35525 RepID=A0ABR0ARC1_9CRUS|nr:hypothetical protein OUZ56_016704 [Daphnia magna]